MIFLKKKKKFHQVNDWIIIDSILGLYIVIVSHFRLSESPKEFENSLMLFHLMHLFSPKTLLLYTAK